MDKGGRVAIAVVVVGPSVRRSLTDCGWAGLPSLPACADSSPPTPSHNTTTYNTPPPHHTTPHTTSQHNDTTTHHHKRTNARTHERTNEPTHTHTHERTNDTNTTTTTATATTTQHNAPRHQPTSTPLQTCKGGMKTKAQGRATRETVHPIFVHRFADGWRGDLRSLANATPEPMRSSNCISAAVCWANARRLH